MLYRAGAEEAFYNCPGHNNFSLTPLTNLLFQFYINQTITFHDRQMQAGS